MELRKLWSWRGGEWDGGRFEVWGRGTRCWSWKVRAEERQAVYRMLCKDNTACINPGPGAAKSLAVTSREVSDRGKQCVVGLYDGFSLACAHAVCGATVRLNELVWART